MMRLAVHIDAFGAAGADTLTFVELRGGIEEAVFVGWVVVVICESWASESLQS
jgi:hypothetical protein